MKNYLKIYLVLIASIFIFSSCEEEIDFNEEQNPVQQNIQLITNGNNKSSNGNSMLHFSTMKIFKETIENLETEYENYDYAFLEEWGHLGNEELDKKEDELNYTPQQPFIDFEKQFKGFESLRKDIETKENIWLKNDILDEANDPYDHFVFDEELRTVLNTKGQVKIGKELYQITMFGYLRITDGDFKTLDLVLNNDARILDLPNVVIVGDYDGTVDNSNTPSTTQTDGTSGSTTTTGASSSYVSCRTSINATQYYYPANKRKIKGYQKITRYDFWHGSSIKAKTRHYKKTRRGWRCRRGWIGVRILGESTVSGGGNPSCTDHGAENENRYKKRRKVKRTVSIPSASNAYIGTKKQKLHTKHRRYSTEYTKYFWY